MNKVIAKQILSDIEKVYPNAKSELSNWKTPFQFLVCVILSAQTTDKQVNKVTGKLFEKYSTLDSLAVANVQSVSQIISSVNYFRHKAKFIVEAAKMVRDKYQGVVPITVTDLISLPGVGPKTANVFLAEIYKDNQGIAVDTHVFRIAHRLGLSDKGTPGQVANDLETLYDKTLWYRINNAFVLYGRYVCKAKNPECDGCGFRRLCNFVKPF